VSAGLAPALAVALATALAAAAVPTNGDKYCTDNNSTTLLVRPASGRDLEFNISSWSGRGHFFGTGGLAHPDAGGWVFREHMESPNLQARCEIRIVAQPRGGYTVWLTPEGPCSEEQGFSPAPGAKMIFPARSRRGGIPASKTMEQASSQEAGGEWCR
jgi:hypothetical protein